MILHLPFPNILKNSISFVFIVLILAVVGTYHQISVLPTLLQVEDMSNKLFTVEYLSCQLTFNIFVADNQCTSTIMLVLIFAFATLLVMSIQTMIVCYVSWLIFLITSCFDEYSYINPCHYLIECLQFMPVSFVARKSITVSK